MECPNCGAKIVEGQKFCNKCGFNLSNIKTEEKKPEVVETTSTNATTISEPENTNTKPIQKEAAPEQTIRKEQPVASASQKTATPIMGFFNMNQSMMFVFILLSAIVYCFNADIGAIIFIIGLLGIFYLYSKNNKANTETELNKNLNGLIPFKNQTENKFWLLETLAYGLNIVAVFKLPFLDLSDVFKLADLDSLTSGITNTITNMFNSGNISLFKLGNLTSKASGILSAYYKEDKTADIADLVRTLSELKWVIYIVIFCIILAIASKFFKNYEIPMQLFAGGIPMIIYLFIYFKIKYGDSDYAIIATFLGSGYYVGLVVSIILVLTSLARVGTLKKRG